MSILNLMEPSSWKECCNFWALSSGSKVLVDVELVLNRADAADGAGDSRSLFLVGAALHLAAERDHPIFGGDVNMQGRCECLDEQLGFDRCCNAGVGGWRG